MSPTKVGDPVLLFITNRRLLEGSRSQVGRAVHFDLADNEPSASLYFCVRNGADDCQELTAPVFLRRLRQSPRRQVLFYIHGFDSLPERQIFPNALSLQALCDRLAPGLLEVVPLIWPCDDDFGLLKDYWDDQAAAEFSGLGFARAIGKFQDWRDRMPESEPCLKHVNIVAHSMGARLLRAAVERWAHDYGAPPSFIRNIFLVAPDIGNASLELDGDGRHLAEAARNLVVYFAHDDHALRTSKVVNLRNKVVGRRLGHSGPRDLGRTPRNVVAVDCDSFNSQIDRFGHSYFLADQSERPSPALIHMVQAMQTGRPPLASEESRLIVLAADFGQPFVQTPTRLAAVR